MNFSHYYLCHHFQIQIPETNIKQILELQHIYWCNCWIMTSQIGININTRKFSIPEQFRNFLRNCISYELALSWEHAPDQTWLPRKKSKQLIMWFVSYDVICFKIEEVLGKFPYWYSDCPSLKIRSSLPIKYIFLESSWDDLSVL